jgi:nitrogen regulatory protein P-II 1
METSSMNCIVAFVQPFQLERIVDALRRLPEFPGMSVSEVRGFGRLAAHPPRAGERSEVDPFQHHVRLEVYAPGSAVSAIVETIRQSARTGHPGDGILFVLEVAWALRIRTGSQGPDALRNDSEG